MRFPELISVSLGYMNPEAIADNTLRINREAALEAIRKQVAEPLNLDVMAAAYGILQVANATMTRALRAVSTERGHDIRDMTLIAFGGAGPMHAAALAKDVGIGTVVIPPHPGLFSALGLLLANTSLDYVRTMEQPLLQSSRARIDAVFGEMETQARREFQDQRIPVADVRFERVADIRVGFMRDEMTLVLDGADATDPASIEFQFRQAHDREFGFAGDGDLYIVNLRLRASTANSPLSFQDLHEAASRIGPAKTRVRMAYFGSEVGEVSTAILNRAAIKQPTAGPLIIEEPDTTAVVPPGWMASSDKLNGIVLRQIASCEIMTF